MPNSHHNTPSPAAAVAAVTNKKGGENWDKFQKKHRHRKHLTPTQKVMAAIVQPALDAVNLDDLFTDDNKDVGKGPLRKWSISVIEQWSSPSIFPVLLTRDPSCLRAKWYHYYAPWPTYHIWLSKKKPIFELRGSGRMRDVSPPEPRRRLDHIVIS